MNILAGCPCEFFDCETLVSDSCEVPDQNPNTLKVTAKRMMDSLTEYFKSVSTWWMRSWKPAL